MKIANWKEIENFDNQVMKCKHLEVNTVMSKLVKTKECR